MHLKKNEYKSTELLKLSKVGESLDLQHLRLLVMVMEGLALEEESQKRSQLQFKKQWKMPEEVWLRLN